MAENIAQSLQADLKTHDDGFAVDCDGKKMLQFQLTAALLNTKHLQAFSRD